MAISSGQTSPPHRAGGLAGGLSESLEITSSWSPGTARYAAEMCGRGGYAELKGPDGTTFANTGECVRYVAQGGTLVPINWVAPWAKSVTLFLYESGLCATGVHVYGFPEGGPYAVRIVDAATGATAPMKAWFTSARTKGAPMRSPASSQARITRWCPRMAGQPGCRAKRSL